jgi:hypothetical protein
MICFRAFEHLKEIYAIFFSQKEKETIWKFKGLS